MAAATQIRDTIATPNRSFTPTKALRLLWLRWKHSTEDAATREALPGRPSSTLARVLVWTLGGLRAGAAHRSRARERSKVAADPTPPISWSDGDIEDSASMFRSIDVSVPRGIVPRMRF